MSKPIKLTEELIASIQQEFVESLRSAKMFDGKLNYSKNFKWDNKEKATLVFSAVAFAKMLMLVQNFTSEVAWHGVVYRDEQKPNKFHVTDIIVYPQTVTGSTVNTDQEAYQNWLYSFDDEVFNNIRLQGHSHVNFSTNPSGVDTTHQEKILSQIDDDMFYIFVIWNQKMERFVKIFDLANNTLYESDEVDVVIGDAGCNLNEFLKGAKDLVKTKTYQTATTTYQSYGTNGIVTSAPTYQPGNHWASKAAQGTTGDSKGKKKKGSSDKNSNADAFDDYLSGYFGNYRGY